MTPYRVLYVLRYYPTLTETFVYREIEELLCRGVEVTVLALGTRVDGAMNDELPRAPVVRLPRGWMMVRGGLVGGGSWGRSGDEQYFSLKQRWRLRWVRRELFKFKFNRVHAHFAGEAGRWARALASAWDIPYSVTAHAVDLYVPQPDFSAIVNDARPVIAVSEEGARRLGDMGTQPRLVRCGVRLSVYTPGRSENVGVLRLVSIARNVPKKGIDPLIALVERFEHPIALRLVSDHPYASARVCSGWAPPSQLPRILREADVFVLNARIGEDGDREGVPVSILEAMASGLPVIVTAVGGIPELVDDAVGWLIPPDDALALCRALKQALNPGERARRGAAARQRILARDLTLERQVSELVAAWRAGDADRA